MQKLAKREEDYMQVLWTLGAAFVKEVITELPDPKPHYNTVATIFKILEEKGFIDHNTYGNSHQYFPLVSKEDYQQGAVTDMIKNYFDNSYLNMVTYFAKEEKISTDDLESIVKLIKKSKK